MKSKSCNTTLIVEFQRGFTLSFNLPRKTKVGRLIALVKQYNDLHFKHNSDFLIPKEAIASVGIIANLANSV